MVLSFKLKHSKVDDRFRMLVPTYIEMADGNIAVLGRGHISRNSSIEQKVPLKGLKTKPKRAMVNYYDDVLASN